MAKVRLPRYLIAREFKHGTSYYWMPPKKLLEKFDLLALRLAEGDGLLSTAIAEAEALNKKLDAIRDGLAMANPRPWHHSFINGV